MNALIQDNNFGSKEAVATPGRSGGNKKFWKKEHQVKIFANEFCPVGFNIQHKQEALEKLSEDMLEFVDPQKTHKFYWEKGRKLKTRKKHPGENDSSLPIEIRGKHFDAWQDLAELLGYGPKR